jgi:hypothetical protein
VILQVALREYQARGLLNVQGWRNSALFEMIHLSKFPKNYSRRGVCEIGGNSGEGSPDASRANLKL